MKKILVSIILLVSFFFIIKYNVENNTKLYFSYKKYIPSDYKKNIRSTLTKINTLYIYNTSNFTFKQKRGIKVNSLKDDRLMRVYTNSKLIWTGPRAYFSSNEDNLFIITGTGILMHVDKKDIVFDSNKIKFKKISTNLDEILNNYIENNFFYSATSMVKSILYKNDNLFISLVQKIDKNCFTHIIYKGKLNFDNINFKEFYKFDRCKPFYTDYLGGSLADYKDNKILVTIGDWTICEDFRWVDKNPKGFCTANGAQSLKTEFGKIFELDLTSKKLSLVSIGHDNPQGIIFNKEDDIIFSTEHGPQGGDEININRYPSKKIKNFGYPISSYGEHYGYPSPDVNYLYEEAPLYKSHEKYGFEEPIDYFAPSIGISDIEKFDNKLLVASMGAEIEQGDLSLHIYTLDKDSNLIKKEWNKVYQRIRDIHIFNDYVFLFLESTGSIGVFHTKNL
tara:strand:+ start:49 stop:1398 length:1350 start_codon:yes stop_codon:yes gene_type:complete